MEKNNFLMPLNGLPAGLSKFDGVADKEFFNSFDNKEITDAQLGVEITAEKSGNYLGIDCSVEGTVETVCDRCMEPLVLPVGVEIKLSLKYGPEESGDDSSSDREVVYISPENTDFDLSQVIYDYVCLSMPPQRFHREGECNPEAVKYLTGGIGTLSQAVENNPFSALKGLFE